MQLYPEEDSSNVKASLSDLSEIIEQARIRCGIPGMGVTVLYKGEVVFSEGFGKRNLHDPFTPETLMPIASLTKAFTATAIGEVVAEGKMDWDTTPVSKYLPEFELEDRNLTASLTLVDLLSHRTGIDSEDLAWFRNSESRRDLIKRMKYIKVDPKLRSACVYNNMMYAVAGEAAANVLGMTYEELVRTKVIDPLGLTNTGLSVMEMKERGDNYAMPFDAASFEDGVKGKFVQGYLDDVYMADAAAGDIYSNTLDLVRWGHVIMQSGMQDGKQVLNKDSVEETKTAYSIFENKTKRTPEFAPSVTYGLGWFIDAYKGQAVYRHNLVIAEQANVNNADLLLDLHWAIADKILGLPKTQDWIDVGVDRTKKRYEEYAKGAAGNLPERIDDKPSTRSLDDFVGTYTHPFYGDISVRLEKEGVGEKLYFNMRKFDNQLVHYHYDSFSVLLEDFVVKVGLLVSFRTGGDGKVSVLQLDLDKPTEFQRMKK
ncbi:hypothetical protein BGX34_005791 [Mortierella sp. NVP85]|nr:hypothetical protein BGX34_005791 [Mortierella sp. NVP85]